MYIVLTVLNNLFVLSLRYIYQGCHVLGNFNQRKSCFVLSPCLLRTTHIKYNNIAAPMADYKIKIARDIIKEQFGDLVEVTNLPTPVDNSSFYYCSKYVVN